MAIVAMVFMLVVLVTKAHTMPLECRTADNHITFGKMSAETPFFIAFPDGSKVVTSYDLGIPLGEESSVLEVTKKVNLL